MRHWLSPLPLGAATLTVLADAGLQPWPSPAAAMPAADCLLLYDSPDRLISALPEQESAAAFTLQQLIDGYTTLLGWAQQTGLPLLCGWQLERLGATGLRQWLSDAEVPPHPVEHAAIAPLIAATTLSLMEAQPSLHEVYADLELQAQLLGREPDLHYRQRLRQQASGQGDALLQALLETLQTPAAVSDLEQQLATKDGELREAREEAELTLLQLQQVQEELEHYFLLARGQDQLLGRYGDQQLRVQKLLAQLTASADPAAAAQSR